MIAFSDEFLIPDQPQSLKEKNLKIGDEYKSSMEIWVAPLEEQGADDVKLSWDLISFEARKLTV